MRERHLPKILYPKYCASNQLTCNRKLTDDASADGSGGDVTALLHEGGESEPHAVVKVEVEATVSVPLAVRTQSRHDKQRSPYRKSCHRYTNPHLIISILILCNEWSANVLRFVENLKILNKWLIGHANESS